MYSFRNDYGEGAHPAILDALLKDNTAQEEGYGMDRHTENSVSMIREQINDPGAEVHLLSGGTQTNLIAISAFLRPHEACIAPATGHISTHETGAIEATGHKLLTVKTPDGKLTPELISPVLAEHHFEHMVKPAMVYISNPTELGTVYTGAELEVLSAYCRKNNLLLYADGARLGAALVIEKAGLSLGGIYRLTDAFFIGGTKLGALLGEALVIRHESLRADFRYLIKQRGGLLAKGRVLGIQFETLFRDNLYFDLARHGNEMARRLAGGLREAGCSFLIDSPTNQIFPVMADPVIEKLSGRIGFYVWAKAGENRSAIRLVTSWATPPEAVEAFLEAYREIKEGVHA